MKPPHTLSVRRCPLSERFSPFFLLGSQPPCSKKKNSPQWNEFMCESQSDRFGWSQGGSETAMLCCSLSLTVFSLHFFPTWYWTPWCSTWVTILPFEIKMASFSKAKADIMQAQRWAIFLQGGVCSSLGWVIAKRESWAEQEERSGKVQRGARLPEQRRAGQLLPWPKKIVTAEKFMRLIDSPIMWCRAISSFGSTSTRLAVSACRKLTLQIEVDVARHHMIALRINLMNILAVTIFFWPG